MVSGQLHATSTSTDTDDNSFEGTKSMLRDSYQLAARGLGRSGGGGNEGAAGDILLMHGSGRDSSDRDRDSAVKRPSSARHTAVAAKRESSAAKARLEASMARGALKATAGARGAAADRISAAAAADRAAARERTAAQKSRATMLAKRAALEAATVQVAKAQIAAEARAKLVKARVQAQSAATRGGTLAKRLSTSAPIGTPPRRTQVEVVVPSQRRSINPSRSRSSGSKTGTRRSAAAPSASLLAGIGVQHDFHMLNLSLESTEAGQDEPVRLSGRR